MAVTPGQLETLLRRAAGRRLAWAVAASLCRLAAVALLTATAAALADAALAVGPPWLITVDAVAAILLVEGVAYLVRAVRGERYEPRRIARLIELRRGICDNRLINAVDLSAPDPAAASPQLCRLATQEGESLAATLSLDGVADPRPMRRALLAALLAAGLFTAMALTMPRVFSAAAARYLDPLADLPPYTRLVFTIKVEPARVRQNRPAEIFATIDGPDLPTTADAVFIDGAGRMRTPMRAGPDGRFTLRIERAERAQEFYIDTPAGRSKRHRMNIDPAPLIERISVAYEPPGAPQRREELGGPGRDEIRAGKGTRVTVQVRSNIALKGGRLTLTPSAGDKLPRVLPLAVGADDPAAASGAFDLVFNGRWKVEVESREGVPSEDAPSGALVCVPVEHPAATQDVGPSEIEELEARLTELEKHGEALLERVRQWLEQVRAKSGADPAMAEELKQLLRELSAFGDAGGKMAAALDLPAAEQASATASLRAALASNAGVEEAMSRLGGAVRAMREALNAMRAARRGSGPGTMAGVAGTGQGTQPAAQPGVISSKPTTAESFNPDGTIRAGGAASLRGVPVRFRDTAEAYFRRLGEAAPSHTDRD